MADRPGVIHEWPSGMTFQQMMDVAVSTYGAGSPEVVDLGLEYDVQVTYPYEPPPMRIGAMVGVGAFAIALYFVLNRTM